MKASEALGSPKLVSVFAFLALVSIAPFAIDPVNSIKFQALVFLGIYCFISMLVGFKANKKNTPNFQLIFTFMFLVGCSTILFLSPGNLNQQLFGAFGRNNGLITQLSLIALFIFVMNFRNTQSITETLKWFHYGTTLSAIYGLLQVLGLDPVNWSGDGKQIVGFVGNTNFQSSLMALGVILILSKTKNFSERTIGNMLLVINMGIHLFIMFQTKAVQGFFLLLSIFLVLVAKKILQISKLWLKRVSLLGYIGIISSTTYLFMATSFFSRLFNFETIEIRKNYWYAAVTMFKDHPLVGVGFDSYGDWYRAFRPEKLNTPLSVVSNSAHNYFLEIMANLGLVGTIFFISGVIYVFKCAAQVLSNKNLSTNQNLTVLYLFTGLVLQSIISPVQIGLLVWIFVFAAEIVAITKIGVITNISSKNSTLPRVKDGNSVKIILCSIMSLAIASPVFIYQISVRSSLDSQDFVKIEKAARRYPADPIILYQIAAIAEFNKLESNQIGLLRVAAKSNPNFYEVWEKIYFSTPIGSQLNIVALDQMKRLEPKWHLILDERKSP